MQKSLSLLEILMAGLLSISDIIVLIIIEKEGCVNMSIRNSDH